MRKPDPVEIVAVAIPLLAEALAVVLLIACAVVWIDEQPREPYEFPIERRFFFALMCLCGGFGLCFLGGQYFYRKRHLVGAAFVGCGWLLGGFGLTLYWLTIFPATWGWLL